jgi:OOP family OmpA-OmpF porin
MAIPSKRSFDTIDSARPALLNGSSRGSMPWPRQRWVWILPLALLPLLTIGVLGAVRHIESDVERAAQEILEDAGIDTTELTLDATYRNIEVGGTLPAGVTAAQLISLLEDGTGPNDEDIRSATVNAQDPTPEALGPIALDGTSDGETLTLTGTVPGQAHEDELLTAANSTGLTIVDLITVSGLEPSARNADDQIRKFSSTIGGLKSGSFTRAELIISDDGPVSGVIDAADPESAAMLDALSGDAVEVSSPPLLGSLDVVATYDGIRIVLNGTVLSAEHSLELVSASSSVVGPDNVVNNLSVADLAERVPGSTARVEALSSVLSTFGGLASADVSLNDTDITVNGEAIDEASQSATTTAVAGTGVAKLRPGGEIRRPPDVETQFTLREEIDLLQDELDSLRDEIREDVVFETNSEQLVEQAREALDKVIDAMNRYPQPVVETGGHTDSDGAADYNLALSQSRADSVVAYITAGGIEAERLRSIGFGEAQPIADNSTEEGRLQNRRVEFVAKESF